MKFLSSQRLRLWLLPAAWLALTASYPVREGAEVQVGMGGGEYEAQGCALDRRRIVGGAATLRYRPQDSGWNGTVSGGVTSEKVVATKDDFEGWGKINGYWDTMGIATTRVGYQGRWMALELGPTVAVVYGHLIPMPSAVLRVNFSSKHSMFVSMMEQYTSMIYAPIQAGYSYDGMDNRFELGVHSSSSAELNFGGVSYQRRITERTWAGLGGRLGTAGERGPQGALLVELAYRNSPPPTETSDAKKPLPPLKWEEFKDAVTGNAKPASKQEW